MALSTTSTFSFHSINVPSEWGHKAEIKIYLPEKEVSIQLMSPASGDTSLRDNLREGGNG